MNDSQKIMRSLLEKQPSGPATRRSLEGIAATAPVLDRNVNVSQAERSSEDLRSERWTIAGENQAEKAAEPTDKIPSGDLGPSIPINHSRARVSHPDLSILEEKENEQEPSYSTWFFEKLDRRSQMISLHIMLQCLPDDTVDSRRDVITTVAAKEFNEDVELCKMLYKEILENGKYVREDNYMELKYDFGSLIGTGATGEVFRAVDRHTDREVAVKVLPNTTSGIKHFKAERETLQMLDHPNIIKLLDSCESLDNEYIVLELCRGVELFEQITNNRYTITEERAARLVAIMIDSIMYMHSRNIVHRDLKPENFLFKSPKEDADIVLIDFGTAKIVKKKEVYTDIAGTPFFVAPEILVKRRRSGALLKAADVWSLGVVCYILMTGQPPFPGKTNPEIFKNIIRRKPRPFPHAVPKQFQDLCLRLLTKNPGKRITLKDAAQHPWLVLGRKHDIKLGKEVVQMLRQFTTQTKLKRAVIKILTQCVSPAETAKLKYQFDFLDLEQNGVLGVNELKLLLISQGIPEFRAAEEAKSIVRSADEDGSGAITFEQFTGIWQRKVLSTNDEYIRTLFTVFDANGDGKIDESELAIVVQGNVDEVKDIIKEVDKSGDGTINFEEFLAAMKETSNSVNTDLLTQDSSVGMGEIKEFEVRRSLTHADDDEVDNNRLLV